ncbi:hypothetical protein AJ78_04124 [Emergomyces pasteurianus Ep9510]|uniref:Antigenic thaumatin-like protein n=1 Tax=Emergomyces pasteurianus Ep9510 TaxID=1447872 RepID=A0A1J9PGT2_9EURO|nr:hypothetical protein AJ78_04124 [Emergomyces pasteurianus Ep9510]
MYTKGAVAAATAFAALLPNVLAGTAMVKNNCDCPVYLWSVANAGNVPRHEIKPGETFSEKYRSNPNGGGISLKISKTYSDAVITQFEYTLAGPKVFYDISNINGYPFEDKGVSLTSSSGCPEVHCPAGVKRCKGAYNNPDDIATHACSSSSDLSMTLCSGGTTKSHQESAQVTKHKDPTPTPTPTPTSTTTTTRPPHHQHPRQFAV